MKKNIGKAFFHIDMQLLQHVLVEVGETQNVVSDMLMLKLLLKMPIFIKENCKFGDECKKPHGFSIPQTRGLLVQHKLDNLSADALKILFRKVLNEKKIKHASSSGPSVCKFYNKGGCKNGDKCEFLHVCQHYIDGSCKFGEQRCKR